MARKAIRKLAKVKVVKVRQSRSTTKALDDKYYGPEPIDISKKGFGDALNWYNYMYEQEEVRDWMFEYMKRNNYSKSDISAVRRVPKYKITKTSCSVARIIMNGNVLPEQAINNLHASIDAYVQLGKLIKEEVKAPKEDSGPTIQERTQHKIYQLITECEEAIDSDPTLNIYEWLKGKEATVQAANAIRDYYAKGLTDFEEDEFDSRTERKRRADQKKYWEAFVADCDRYCGNKKATKVRKPREKKVKSAVDQVSKMKYQKEFPPLKIVSVNPAEIVGCKQLWTYNTKYKKLSRYDASGPNGIQVKGTTLIGFDATTSLTKSLRKPDVSLQSLLTVGKVALRSFMTDIKTNETKPNGRINTDTIILRVVK
jgi:RPA family protein